MQIRKPFGAKLSTNDLPSKSKEERRKVAAALRHTGLSLPIRFRLAKFFVNGSASGFWDLTDLIKHLGLHQIEFIKGCECCGDHTYIYSDDKKGRLMVKSNHLNYEVQRGYQRLREQRLREQRLREQRLREQRS